MEFDPPTRYKGPDLRSGLLRLDTERRCWVKPTNVKSPAPRARGLLGLTPEVEKGTAEIIPNAAQNNGSAPNPAPQWTKRLSGPALAFRRPAGKTAFGSMRILIAGFYLLAY